jgi:hypothetical protein
MVKQNAFYSDEQTKDMRKKEAFYSASTFTGIHAISRVLLASIHSVVVRYLLHCVFVRDELL